MKSFLSIYKAIGNHVEFWRYHVITEANEKFQVLNVTWSTTISTSLMESIDEESSCALVDGHGD